MKEIQPYKMLNYKKNLFSDEYQIHPTDLPSQKSIHLELHHNLLLSISPQSSLGKLANELKESSDQQIWVYDH